VIVLYLAGIFGAFLLGGIASAVIVLMFIVAIEVAR
jgi:hypothetical protein